MSFVTTVLGPSPNVFKEGAVLINRHGRRFTDETCTPARDLVSQPEGLAYIVFDGALGRRFSGWPHYISTAPGLTRSFLSWENRAGSDPGIAYAYLQDYRRTRPDLFHEARSVPELAAAIGVPADALGETLCSHAAEAKEHRAPYEPPFFALGPVKGYVPFTDGGLAITPRFEVVRDGIAPIRGLYACGAVGQGGLLLEGHGHHLAWCFISGRMAGRHAAFDVPHGTSLADQMKDIAL